jgi:hypothetical protein
MAALLALSGCGGGSSSSSGQSTPGSQPVSVPSSAPSGSGDNADFCKKAQAQLSDVTTQLGPLGDPTASPEKVKKIFSTVEAGYARVIAIAPAEIKPDLETLRSAIKALNAAYADGNYDAAAMATQLLPLLTDQKLQTAAQHIGDWSAKNCPSLQP